MANIVFIFIEVIFETEKLQTVKLQIDIKDL